MEKDLFKEKLRTRIECRDNYISLLSSILEERSIDVSRYPSLVASYYLALTMDLRKVICRLRKLNKYDKLTLED